MKEAIAVEEERECFNNYYKTNDLSYLVPVFRMLDKLIDIKLSKISRLKQFTILRSQMELEDIKQEFYIFMIKQLKEYDLSKGFRFSTFILNDTVVFRFLYKLSLFVNKEKRHIHLNEKRFSELEVYSAMENDFIPFEEVLPSSDPSIEDQVMAHNLRLKLIKSVNSPVLTEKERDAIRDRLIEAKPKNSNAYCLVFSGVNKLREMLK